MDNPAGEQIAGKQQRSCCPWDGDRQVQTNGRPKAGRGRIEGANGARASWCWAVSKSQSLPNAARSLQRQREGIQRSPVVLLGLITLAWAGPCSITCKCRRWATPSKWLLSLAALQQLVCLRTPTGGK